MTPYRAAARCVATLALAALAANAPAPALADDPLAAARASILAARGTLLDHLARVKTHSDDAYDIVERIEESFASLDDERARHDAPYAQDKTLEAHLNATWVDAAIAGVCPTPPATGASETCFRATADGTLQPLALYVPPGLGAARAPLVVLLRGRGETETDLLSRREVRALADASRTIVAAPYARGRALYDRAATQDVLDALDASELAFTIDPHRVFIGGFSMGGIAAFHIAAAAPARFAAILSIVGALNPEDRDGMRAFRDKPAYVVNAENDELIPSGRGKASVRYLRSIGMPTRYYEQAGGTHALRSVLPAMTRAWNDMFAGITAQSDDDLRAPGNLPPVPATPAVQKPS